jgi:hypothetical protein
MAKTQSVAVAVAREQQAATTSDIVTLSTGVRARIRPVAAFLVEAVRLRIPLPRPPVQKIPEKGDREEENPFDPEYKRQLADAQRQRNLAVGDAYILFGAELVDPVPDDGWEQRLQLLGLEVDVADPLARDFAFKKYVAVGNADLQMIISRSSGVSEEEVAQAAELFRRRAARDADSGTPAAE